MRADAVQTLAFCIVLAPTLNKLTGTTPVTLGFVKALKESGRCDRVALLTYDEPNTKFLKRVLPELWDEPHVMLNPVAPKAGLLDYLKLIADRKVLFNVHADLVPYPSDVNYFHTVPLGAVEGLKFADENRFKLYEPFVQKEVLNLANSFRTMRELKRYGIRADVLYPVVPQPPLPPKRGGEYVLYFGRIAREKRVERILWLAERLKDRQFVIAGKPEYPYFREFVRKARELQNVRVLTDVPAEQKWELLQNAEVMVHTREDEPFGIAPLEAVLVGTPALVSCSAGASEVLRPHIPCWQSFDEVLQMLERREYGDVQSAVQSVKRCCSYTAFKQKLLALLDAHQII